MLNRILNFSVAIVLTPPAIAGQSWSGHPHLAGVPELHVRRAEFADKAPPGAPAYWSNGKRMKGCSVQPADRRDPGGTLHPSHVVRCNVHYLEPAQPSPWITIDKKYGGLQ